MADALKWAIIAALLGVSNIGTYNVTAKPEIERANETQAAAKIIGDELQRCYDRLDECRERCP